MVPIGGWACYAGPMKVKALSSRGAALFVALTSVTGCASQGGRVDPSQYAASSCVELNNAIGETSENISTTAIGRGKVSQWDIPIWAPGGAKAVSAIKSRQTAKIDQLQAEQAALVAARNRQCS